MPERVLRLRDDLEGVEVVLDDHRDLVSVTAAGQPVICRMTQFGLICDPIPPPPGAGGGNGPVLQLKVTSKRVFARRVPDGTNVAEISVRSGFQRHAF